MAIKKKAKPANKRQPKRKTKKAPAAKTSLVKTIYNQSQQLNFASDYHQTGSSETCNLYPRNAHAERIIVRQEAQGETQSEVSMCRIAGGTNYDTLSVVVPNGSKAEAHAQIGRAHV